MFAKARAVRSGIRWLPCAALVMTCTSPRTSIVLHLDTDMEQPEPPQAGPSGTRPLLTRVSVEVQTRGPDGNLVRLRDGRVNPDDPFTIVRTRRGGPVGVVGLTLPVDLLSVEPAGGDATRSVLFIVTAWGRRDAGAGDDAVLYTRRVETNWVKDRAWWVGVRLTARCVAQSPPCEAFGQTCGDRGECVDVRQPSSAFVPYPDSRRGGTGGAGNTRDPGRETMDGGATGRPDASAEEQEGGRGPGSPTSGTCPPGTYPFDCDAGMSPPRMGDSTGRDAANGRDVEAGTPGSCAAESPRYTVLFDHCGDYAEAYTKSSVNIGYYPYRATVDTELRTGAGVGSVRLLPIDANTFVALQSEPNPRCLNWPPLRRAEVAEDGTRFVFGYVQTAMGLQVGPGWINRSHLAPTDQTPNAECMRGPSGRDFQGHRHPELAGCPELLCNDRPTCACEPDAGISDACANTESEGSRDCTMGMRLDSLCRGIRGTESSERVLALRDGRLGMWHAPGSGIDRILHPGDDIRVLYGVRVADSDWYFIQVERSPANNIPRAGESPVRGWVDRAHVFDLSTCQPRLP